MKHLLFNLALFGTTVLLGQNVFSLSEYTYEGDEPIHVEKIANDSLSSAFVIWIHDQVKAHVHAKHTEYVLILEGYGKMQLGDKTVQMKEGDLIHIPSNTVHSALVESSTRLKVLSVQTPEFKGKDRIFVRPYQENKD